MTADSHLPTTTGTPVADDGRRYLLTGPRGVSQLLDTLDPSADHHTIAVYGSQDLAQRVNEANDAGVCVSWRQLDDDGWQA